MLTVVAALARESPGGREKEENDMDPVAHASIALMARPAAPKAHPLVLIAATQVPDLLFFAFEAAGIEHQAVTKMDFRRGLTYLSPARIPWSHGLTACIVWSAVAGALDCHLGLPRPPHRSHRRVAGVQPLGVGCDRVQQPAGRAR